MNDTAAKIQEAAEKMCPKDMVSNMEARIAELERALQSGSTASK